MNKNERNISQNWKKRNSFSNCGKKYIIKQKRKRIYQIEHLMFRKNVHFLFIEFSLITFEMSAVSRSCPERIRLFAFAFCHYICKWRIEICHWIFCLSSDHKTNILESVVYLNELPRERTRALRLGVVWTAVQRKKPWFSTHFFQKFLHSLRPSKKKSTVSL